MTGDKEDSDPFNIGDIMASVFDKAADIPLPTSEDVMDELGVDNHTPNKVAEVHPSRLSQLIHYFGVLMFFC